MKKCDVYPQETVNQRDKDQQGHRRSLLESYLCEDCNLVGMNWYRIGLFCQIRRCLWGSRTRDEHSESYPNFPVGRVGTECCRRPRCLLVSQTGKEIQDEEDVQGRKRRALVCDIERYIWGCRDVEDGEERGEAFEE